MICYHQKNVKKWKTKSLQCWMTFPTLLVGCRTHIETPALLGPLSQSAGNSECGENSRSNVLLHSLCLPLSSSMAIAMGLSGSSSPHGSIDLPFFQKVSGPHSMAVFACLTIDLESLEPIKVSREWRSPDWEIDAKGPVVKLIEC